MEEHFFIFSGQCILKLLILLKIIIIFIFHPNSEEKERKRKGREKGEVRAAYLNSLCMKSHFLSSSKAYVCI